MPGRRRSNSNDTDDGWSDDSGITEWEAWVDECCTCTWKPGDEHYRYSIEQLVAPLTTCEWHLEKQRELVVWRKWHRNNIYVESKLRWLRWFSRLETRPAVIAELCTFVTAEENKEWAEMYPDLAEEALRACDAG